MLKQEIDSLVPASAFSRRRFVQTGLGSGFAAAVLPASAQAIRTDRTGISAGEVTIPVGDFRMPAFRARPEGRSAGLPVLLVVSEIFGVHEYIADITVRFARLGYLAIAPELFVRQGDAQGYGEVGKLVAEVVSKASDAQVLGDLDATVAWARAEGADTGRLGITGFCWGGRTTLMYAAHNPAVKAAVAWYGALARSDYPGDRTALEVAPQIKAAVLGLYGGADPGIPTDTVEQMRKALQAAGNTRSEFIVYPDTPHAFHADYRPSYRKAQAEDGWRRAVAWFKAHGVA